MTKTRLLRTLFLCPLFMLIMQQSWAQTKSVSGKVTDEKGAGVSGASVLVKGSRAGTSTDAAGSFHINVPASATTLVVSYVGYVSQEISIASVSDVTVGLVPDNTGLSEVVVIGYGTARKRDLTGAVASVQAKDFNKGVIVSPDQLLQNKVAGLDITSNGGQPGTATTVKIRGNNSLRTASNPLYVIDGVPLDGRSARPNPGSSFGSTPDENPLNFINPSDIQTIDVLKDASSEAIYGSRGANGVIAITTKTGSSGAAKLEAGISYGFNAGYMKKYDVLNETQYKSALTKYGVTGQDFGGNVDALDAILNHNVTQNYSLAFSGGNENGRFRASFLGSSAQGTLKNSSLDRYIGNFGGQYKFLDKRLTLNFDLITAHSTENILAVANNSGSTGNLISAALQWNPTQSFTDASGNFIYPQSGSNNPIAELAAFSDIASINTTLANISASYKLLPNLEYKFLYAINNSVGTRNTNLYAFLQGGIGGGIGQADISGARLTSQTFTHTLNYNTQLTQSLHLDALAGFEYWKSDYSNNSFAASGFQTNTNQFQISVPYTSNIQGANALGASAYVDPTTELQSYFGRVQLNYLDKYLLTGTFRADGSSKFGANNKYGYFPSVGARWVISNENFMKSNTALSNLSLRASWGITGNQEFPAGSAEDQYGIFSYGSGGLQNSVNPNLKWEKTTSWDIGLDFTSKNGRVYGTIDYYNKNTTDLLFQTVVIQPAPTANIFLNLPAQVSNNGIEVSLGFTLVEHKNFTWDVRGYYAYNKNLLTNFNPNLIIQTGAINGQGVSGTLGEAIANNQPVDVFYLKQFQGFDHNGNQTYAANPSFAGDPNPKSTYGISTTLTYKKVSLVLNGGGSGGFLIYNNTATSVTNIAGIANGRNISLNAYNSPEMPSSPVAANTRFLESGNFFKLRNVTLSYSVGNAGKYVKNLNIFVSGSNLFVITKFSGFDPEVNVDESSGGYPSRSMEYIPYPTSRIISAGLNFSL